MNGSRESWDEQFSRAHRVSLVHEVSREEADAALAQMAPHVEIIGPADARAMLGPGGDGTWLQNVPDEQVPVEPDRVRWFAKQMKAGQWGKARGNPISVHNGQVVDGHHRLCALIEAGVTLLFPVRRTDG